MVDKSVKVSVIMAVFNAMPYLEQALQTICEQTLKEIEIICVDDGSTDNSYDYLLKIQKKDQRIKIFRHMEKTDGAAAARNMGIDNACGEYLSIVDSDDFFETDMLEKAYRKAKEIDADVLLFDAWCYDNKTGVDKQWEYLKEEYLKYRESFDQTANVDVFNATHGAAWDKLFKHSFICDNNISFTDCKFTDDVVFTYTALCLADKIGVLREKLVHYRINTGTNQSSTVHNLPEIGYKAPYQLKCILEEKNIYEKYRVSFAKYFGAFAWQILDRLDSKESYASLFWALKNEYLEKLGIMSLRKEEYENIYHYVCRESMVKANSITEYFVLRDGNPLLKGKNYEKDFTLHVPAGSRVAIYGAGIKGRKAFSIVFNSRDYSVAIWVDRKFNDIGYPVRSPEELLDTTFDYLWIAIESEKIAESIKKDLSTKGLDESKMIWI